MTPLAVMAFADGVPRIGEDVIKIVANGAPDNPYYAQCSLMSWDALLYEGKDNGSDGSPLQLVKKCELILEQQQVIPGDHLHGDPIKYLDTDYYYDFEANPDNFYRGSGKNSHTFYWESFTKTDDADYIIVRHYLVNIGPILYCIEFTWTYNYSGDIHEHFYTEVIDPDLTWDDYNFYPVLFADWMAGAISVNAEYAALLAEKIAEGYGTDKTIQGLYSPTSIMCCAVYAAPFSDKLYEATKAVANAPTMSSPEDCEGMKQAYEGFTFQEMFTNSLYTYFGANIIGSELDIFVRPHSKAELQAAGLWPEGAG